MPESGAAVSCGPGQTGRQEASAGRWRRSIGVEAPSTQSRTSLWVAHPAEASLPHLSRRDLPTIAQRFNVGNARSALHKSRRDGCPLAPIPQMARFARQAAAYYGHEFDRVGAEETASGNHPAR